MTSKAGLSGANVYVVGDKAIKVDRDAPTRVIEQGEWLQRNQGEQHLPFVYNLLPHGYVMEALDPLPTSEIALYRLVDALTASVWRYAPKEPVDTAQTMLKCYNILDTHAPHLAKPVTSRLAYIRGTSDCQTHGDPTAENVMLRGDTYVIIDPIPATWQVPDDLAVDVGKILQSAHGWEKMKGESRVTWDAFDVKQFFTPEVFEVAELWCIVHFVRTLPYARLEVKKRVIDKLEELLGIRR